MAAEGHLARFLADVVSSLDLGAMYKSYLDKDGSGQAAYAPERMVRVLFYGYANGVYSSRKIEKRTYEDVAFRYLAGDQHPDHSVLAEFRKRHLEALAGLFTQALLLCAEAGLVKLGPADIFRSNDGGDTRNRFLIIQGLLQNNDGVVHVKAHDIRPLEITAAVITSQGSR